jgi:hypothetical protein
MRIFSLIFEYYQVGRYVLLPNLHLFLGLVTNLSSISADDAALNSRGNNGNEETGVLNIASAGKTFSKFHLL